MGQHVKNEICETPNSEAENWGIKIKVYNP